MTDHNACSIWVCYPPPGSGLPRKRIAAESRNRAMLKLGKFIDAAHPEWRHAVPNYVIRRKGEPAP